MTKLSLEEKQTEILTQKEGALHSKADKKKTRGLPKCMNTCFLS